MRYPQHIRFLLSKSVQKNAPRFHASTGTFLDPTDVPKTRSVIFSLPELNQG